ncbi:1229_t:CDS:1, partial [Dentiscutata heterogama]
LAYEKCSTKRTLEDYPYLEIGKQLCHPHYCKIVEPSRNKRAHKSKKAKTADF